MATTKALDDFAISFITKGSKQVMVDMQNIIKKMNQMQDLINGTADATDLQTEKTDKNTQANNKNTQSINKQNSALWTYAKRLVGVYSIYKLMKKGVGLAINFAEKGNALANMSTLSGASTQSIQKWGLALKKFNGDEKSITATLGALQSALYNYRYNNGEEFNKFMEYGGSVPTGNNAEEFLVDIARQMEGWDDDKKRFMASLLGLDPATTAFLMQGQNAVKKQLNKAETLFSPQDIKAAQLAKENLIEFEHQLETTGVIIGKVVLPYMTEALKELQKLLKNPVGWLDKVSRKVLPKTGYNALESFGGALAENKYKAQQRRERRDHYYFDSFREWVELGNPINMENFLKLRRLKELHNAISNASFLTSPYPNNSLLNSNFSQDNSITINGSDSPQATGQEVIRAITDWSKDSIFNQVASMIGVEKA